MDVPQKQQQQRIGGVGIDVVLVGNDAPADDGSTPRATASALASHSGGVTKDTVEAQTAHGSTEMSKLAGGGTLSVFHPGTRRWHGRMAMGYGDFTRDAARSARFSCYFSGRGRLETGRSSFSFVFVYVPDCTVFFIAGFFLRDVSRIEKIEMV
jgi:hypothetical protein